MKCQAHGLLALVDSGNVWTGPCSDAATLNFYDTRCATNPIAIQQWYIYTYEVPSPWFITLVDSGNLWTGQGSY